MRKGSLNLFIMGMIWGGLIANPCFAMPPPAMAGLQKLLTEANDERAKLDSTLVDALKDMQATQVNDSKTYLLETTLLAHEAKIGVIREKLIENHLVIEFLNSFISAMESANNPQVDAPKILLELAHKQILDSVETMQDSIVWSYEQKLAIAIRDIMEPSEKFADFIKMFMTKYPLSKPVSLGDLPKNRTYINGQITGSTPTRLSNPTED